jgi:DNA ligase (NAD+)
MRIWFAIPQNLQIVYRLAAAGVQLAYAEREKASEALAGLKFVVSGVFEAISRDDLQELIRAHGGTLQSGVSKATDYLVAGTNMGPAKLEKASKLGVKIISFEQLQQMLG